MNEKPNRWYVLALMPALLMPVIVALTRTHRAEIIAMWPHWRGMIEQVTLFAAGLCLLAAIVAGVVTWRRESRRHA